MKNKHRLGFWLKFSKIRVKRDHFDKQLIYGGVPYIDAIKTTLVPSQHSQYPVRQRRIDLPVTLFFCLRCNASAFQQDLIDYVIVNGFTSRRNWIVGKHVDSANVVVDGRWSSKSNTNQSLDISYQIVRDSTRCRQLESIFETVGDQTITGESLLIFEACLLHFSISVVNCATFRICVDLSIIRRKACGSAFRSLISPLNCTMPFWVVKSNWLSQTIPR